MIKKTLIAFMMALVLGLGVLVVVNTTYAQDVELQELPSEPEEAAFEYEYAFQYGEQNGDDDPVQTRNRVRTQLRELHDGECMGEGDPQQLRLQQGAENQGFMRQKNLNLRDGTCNGNCGRQFQGDQDQ